MQITVLGAGAWGTALAQVLSENGHQTTLWTWQVQHALAMNAQRKNEACLPDMSLHADLRVTGALDEAVRSAELLVVVVPSHTVRATILAAQPFLREGVKIVCASKGIEQETLLLMSEVLISALSAGSEGQDSWEARIGVISGPSFAKEVALRIPTNLVAASTSPSFATELQVLFSNEWLRVYTGNDSVGVEVGGALKNVIAIAAGASDGLGLGNNTRAALITRGVAEMGRLVHAMGGQGSTTAGLAGMGDLVLTCTGAMSRNRTLGEKLGRGVSLQEALSSSQGVAEGYISAKSAHDLAKKLQVELPICEAVYSVLYGGFEPQRALQGLLSRPLRAE